MKDRIATELILNNQRSINAMEYKLNDKKQ